MDTIEEKKKKRLLLLKELYDKSEGNSQVELKPSSLASYDEGTVFYLMGEGLISKAKRRTKGSPIEYSITHKGIKEIEEAHDNPSRSTAHLPPFNIINIQNMNHSAIQQGTHNSSQRFTLMSEKGEEVEKLLDELNNIKEQLKEGPEERIELGELISTIQAQISSPKPKDTILRAALSEVKGFLLGVDVNLYTPVLKETIEKWIGQ